MSEKPPQFERPPVPIYGKASEEEKKKLSQEIERRFTDGDITDLPDELIAKIQSLEYKKEEHHLEYISSANQIINRMRKGYGLPEFDVPEKNIHIIPDEIFKQLTPRGLTAFHDFRRQLIMADFEKINFSGNKTISAGTFLHEMIHLAGFLSLDIQQDQDDRRTRSGSRRVGFIVSEGFRQVDKDTFYESFHGLNEAVVAELEGKYMQEVIISSSDPEVRDEVAWLESNEAKDFKEVVAKQENIPVSEVAWISRNGENWILRSYRSQRRTLEYLVTKIAEDTEKNAEEIYDIFFKAHFTGNILEISKLIEKSFGVGSFRALGMMTVDKNSGNQMLDYLKKQRIQIKKSAKED